MSLGIKSRTAIHFNFSTVQHGILQQTIRRKEFIACCMARAVTFFLSAGLACSLPFSRVTAGLQTTDYRLFHIFPVRNTYIPARTYIPGRTLNNRHPDKSMKTYHIFRSMHDMQTTEYTQMTKATDISAVSEYSSKSRIDLRQEGHTTIVVLYCCMYKCNLNSTTLNLTCRR